MLYGLFFVSLREKELEARQGGMENLEGVGDGKNMTETYSTFIRLNKTEKNYKILENYDRQLKQKKRRDEQSTTQLHVFCCIWSSSQTFSPHPQLFWGGNDDIF